MTPNGDTQAKARGRRRMTVPHLRDFSLKQKLVAIIMLTCVPALLLAGGVFIAWEWVSLRHAMVRDVSAQAGIIAQNCRAAVAFKDRADASAVLQTLDTLPSIVAACLRSKDERIFASYARSGHHDSLSNLDMKRDGAVFTLGNLVVQMPVTLDRERIGTLTLRADLKTLYKRLERSLIVIVGILVAASAAAYLLSARLQRIISQPVLDLAGIARSVAEEKQYAVRAQCSSHDEVGLLVQAFNAMLEQIQQRDAALVEANVHLEARVAERTAELSSANARLEGEITERKRIEDELRLSEERFRVLFEYAPDAYFLHDSQGRFLDINKKAEQLIGYGREEQIGRTIIDLGAVPPEEVDTVRSLAAESASGLSRASREVVLNRKDGVQITVEITTLPVRIKGVPVVLGIARDITARRQTEKELRSSVERFRQVAECAGEFIWEVDADGLYTYANPVIERVLGYKPQDIVGKKHFYDFFIPEERDRLKTLALTGFANKESLHGFVNSNIHRDGHIVILETSGMPVVDPHGNLIGYRGADTDVTDRSLADERLRQQKDLLKNIISHIPHFVFWKDRDSVYLGCNEAFAKSAGVESPDDIIGKTDYDLVWKENADSYRQYDRQIMESGEPLLNFDEGQTREDGSQIARLTSKVPLRDAFGNVVGILGIYNDITERKQAEEALRDSEAIFRAIFDHANDGMLLADTVKKTFSAGNNTICQMLGYSLEEMKKLGVTDIHPKEDLPYVIEQFERQLRGEIAVAKDLPVKRKDGSVFYADVNSSLVTLAGRTHVLGLFRDITERKRAENQIQQDSQIQSTLNKLLSLSLEDLTMEEMLKQAIDYITSTAGFTLESKGAAFLADDKQEMLVMTAQRGITAPLLTICARVPFGRCACGRAALSGEVEFVDCVDERHENTFDGIHPHGHYCVPILSGGKVLGVINTYVKEGHRRCQEEEDFLRAAAAVLAGVIERKQADKRQTELLQQLARANRELKDFVYVASHDLRAPVRKIVSFGQLLQESLADKLADDDKENLEFMIEGAGRMHELIEALLVYSRVSTKDVQLGCLDLNQIIDELRSVELAVPLEETTGTVSIPEPLPTVQGDVVQIRQLLQNLVSNGLKYHKKDVAPQVTIQARRQDDGMVRVDVQDNGIGIEPQYHDKLFVMFQRLHSSAEYEGTGIGLAVCKKIIERHKGEIGITSTPGEGSTFWFTLPASQTCEEQGEPTAASLEPVNNTV
jgi:PAS domain S-box-containing protein